MRVLMGIIGVLAALLLGAAACDLMTPDTSPEVTVVGDNVIRIPQGTQAVFTKFSTKTETYNTWVVTYDGKTVHSACQPMCMDASTDIGAVGQEVKVNINAYVVGQFTATKQTDGSIYFTWPRGMDLGK